jgi:hypothetical protein
MLDAERALKTAENTQQRFPVQAAQAPLPPKTVVPIRRTSPPNDICALRS